MEDEQITPEENTEELAPEAEGEDFVDPNLGTVKLATIERVMENRYLDYAMSVIVSRALPDVRDGLKPVHRRILYAMNSIGLRHTAKYRKSANVVGEVMAKYHPHGDAAIYDSMVRMAQDFSTRYPLVDGQGNFGSMDGDSAAAMRYTEARMTRIAEELLFDIEKETVDFRPNYDGSHKEPVVLPAKLPNLLLNGQMGIAVGMATNIPPHNLAELVDGTIHLVDNPESTVEDLMKFIKGPDFPTGGTIYGNESIRQAYGTGKGSVVIRAVAEIEEDKKGNFHIIITEIPYAQNKASLVEKIADLVRDKKVTGISDLRDESSRKGVRIVIDLKKDAYPKKILNQLYKLTPMQTAFHFNMLALIDGIQPRIMSLEMILKEFIGHRRQVVRRRTEFELRKAKDRAHILEGLKIALDHIDEVIATIRSSRTTDDAKTNLIKKFKLTVLQADAILAMQLRTLAGLERQKIEDQLAELLKLISELEKILADEKEILRIIKEELLELKEKYGDKRRTKIIASELGKFSEEELVPNEQVIVTLTQGNYVKRVPSITYRSQGRGGKGIMGMTTKEEDVVEHLVLTHNHDFVLFFTNKGRVFRLKVYEIPAASRTAKGQAIVNLLQLQPDEKITSLNTFSKDDAGQYLFMTTKMGTVKKTALADYANVRASGLIAIKLDDGDELRWVKQTSGKDEIIISTALAQAIRFKEADARPMGRATRGVRGVRLRPGDSVVGMDVVQPGMELLVVMENGYGKRTKVDQFATHARGGVGIKAGVVTDKTGRALDVRAIPSAEDDLVVVSSNGVVIRIALKGISLIGRATQGVRIMRLNDGDKVASVALIGESKIEEEIEEEVDTEKSEA
ncbi:MAG TPA: DNA gyrase subunit A [Candidatus Saccharimonadales bacterium]|nr:DNA gyrase subunit A [Candidatus Saccharimonadales bacterium]